MKRVVLTTWGSFGDLYPFMTLALELQKRGHVAVIATSLLYREIVGAAEMLFMPCARSFHSPAKKHPLK